MARKSKPKHNKVKLSRDNNASFSTIASTSSSSSTSGNQGNGENSNNVKGPRRFNAKNNRVKNNRVGNGSNTNNNNKGLDDLLGTLAELRMLLNKSDIPATLVAIILGHANAKSPAFDVLVKEAIKSNWVQQTKQACIKFTPKGLDEAIPNWVIRPTDNKLQQSTLRRMLRASIVTATPNGDTTTIVDKILAVFETLLDGHVHTRESLMNKHQIKATDFGYIVKALKDLNLIGKGRTQELQVTDIAFPFGRN